MVGVPRSQGCRTCRRKKKGCDQAKPTCGQCTRLLLKCIYDEKQWTFVSQQSPSGTSASRGSSTTPNTTEAASLSIIGQQPQSIGRTTLEVEISEAFWTAYWPKEDSSASIGGVKTSPWIETLQYFASQDDTARIALDAVALTALGRLREDEVLLQQALRLYTRALYATNQLLQHPDRATSDAVLALCRILGMYETIRGERGKGVPSQGTDWQRHVDGTCRLIELRGLEKHASGHSSTLFAEAKAAAMISGITRRKPNVFCADSWRNAPQLGANGSLRTELHGIMLLIPGIMQAFDELQRNPVSSRSSALDGRTLLGYCVQVSQSLQEWESKAFKICAQTRKGLQDTLASLRDCCMHFSYGFFHTVMHYFAACLLLYSTTWLVLRQVGHGNGKSARNPLPGIPDPQQYASNISACSPYYFRPEAGLWGPQNASFPMGAALHFFAATGQHSSPDMERMRRLFRVTKQAEMTSEFLRSMAADAAPTAVRGDARNRTAHERMSSKWYGVEESRMAQRATLQT